MAEATIRTIQTVEPFWLADLHCRASFKVLNNTFLAKDEK